MVQRIRDRQQSSDPRVPNGPCVEFIGHKVVREPKSEDDRDQWRDDDEARSFLRLGDPNTGAPGCHNRIEAIMPYIEKGWYVKAFHNIPDGDPRYREIQSKAKSLGFIDGGKVAESRKPARGTQRKLEEAKNG